MKWRRTALLLTTALGMACASDPGGESAGAAGEHAGGSSALGEAGHAGSPAADPAAVDCTNATQYADVAAFHKCTMCHSTERTSAARSGAPAAINFDSEAEAKPYAKAAQTVVSGGIMPPRSSGLTLTEAEKQQLYGWTACMDR